MNQDKKIGEYANKRLSNGRDDRTEKSKKEMDAWLRGDVGVHKANEIIKVIDDLKSRR